MFSHDGVMAMERALFSNGGNLRDALGSATCYCSKCHFYVTEEEMYDQYCMDCESAMRDDRPCPPMQPEDLIIGE